MRALFVLVLALLAFPAQAKETARYTEGTTQVRLFDERGAHCPKDTARVELWLNNKKAFDGCYVDLDGVVYIIWSDGDLGQLPRSVFKPGV